MEHEITTKRQELIKSGLVRYAWTEFNRIEWETAQIIHKEDHWYKRKLKDAVYITSIVNCGEFR